MTGFPSDVPPRGDGHGRIAHIADLHLCTEQRQESLEALDFAIRTAINAGCDALVIAGDVWDRAVSVDDKSAFTAAMESLQLAAGRMPVLLVYGNHDRPGSLEPFEIMGGTTTFPIRVFDRPMTVNLAGMAFSMLPYPQKSRIASWVQGGQEASDETASDMLRAICRGFAAQNEGDLPHVLVYHGNVTGCIVESGQTLLGGDVMIGAADLEASGADYVALGHIHGRQMLGTRCWYPGSTYHTDFGEIGPRWMHIVDVGRGWHEVHPVEMPSRPKITVDGLDGLDIEALRDADVKLRVRMTAEEAATWDEEWATEYLRIITHSLRVERIIVPRERIRAAEVTEARSLRDKVAAWGAAVSEEIPAGVLEKADEIEGGAQ